MDEQWFLETLANEYRKIGHYDSSVTVRQNNLSAIDRAGKVGSDNCNDICDACCQIECKRLSDLAMIEEQTNPCIAPIIEIGAP